MHREHKELPDTKKKSDANSKVGMLKREQQKIKRTNIKLTIAIIFIFINQFQYQNQYCSKGAIYRGGGAQIKNSDF